MTDRYRAAHLLLPSGWASPGFIEVGRDGLIVSAGVEPLPEPVSRLDGFVVSGVPNLHSHAHQRGLVGWVDRLAPGSRETLWTWRRRMYDHVLALSPENLEAQAAQAYVEMLKTGFTAVGEFHYVHHDPGGRPYANPAEMSERIVSAARRAGIGLTLLPAFYAHGGIGRPPEPDQRRFVHGVDAYLELVDAVVRIAREEPCVVAGIAPHSLRAVGAAELRALLDAVPDRPVHIHVSERVEEVEDLRGALGAAPVRWLLDAVGLGPRWTLVHATHTDDGERAGMIGAGVVAGLCPLTEANLGDGLFALSEYARSGGVWGVGSDSNHLIDLPGELRLAEYGQRLRHQRRDVLVGPDDTSAARVLLESALAGGAQALAQPVGAIAPGFRADLVELDPAHPALAGQAAETALDAWIFSSASPGVVRNVMVGGRWVIRDGRHEDEEQILDAFRATMRERHGAA